MIHFGFNPAVFTNILYFWDYYKPRKMTHQPIINDFAGWPKAPLPNASEALPRRNRRPAHCRAPIRSGLAIRFTELISIYKYMMSNNLIFNL